MDSNVLSIVLGLITNGLTSILTIIGQKSGQFLVGKDFLEKWEAEKGSLQTILQRSIKEVSESIQWTGPSRDEIVCLFLLSPEVEEIVRQIYSTKLLLKKEKSGLKGIQKIFIASFSLFVTSYPSTTLLEREKFSSATDLLFNVLLEGCNIALSNAINKGILSAHEAKSAFRHQILLDEFAAIQKKLDLLTTQSKLDMRNILAFEKKYRQQISNRHKDITPPYLDIAKKIPIDKIYIQPRFIKAFKQDGNHETLEMTAFLSSVYRAVVLGQPGGGKSTLALKLCHDLTTHYDKHLFAGRKQLTPILVVLREYGAEKKVRNCSILQFIEGKANANYQVQPPPGAFEYLLLSGRSMIIFDGLDELLDTGYRQEITNDVDSFCNLYPSVPILVTSREIGYEQAPLDEKQFPAFRLAPLDNTQVQEYANKWFKAAYNDLSINQREYKAKKFLNECKFVPDLRSNPLMLALLCSIYRGENYIPRNRPDVYEKCAIMLFERWDKSRGINMYLAIDWHIRPLMEFLAYWIFIDERLRGGVTEEELITKATEYVFEWVFDDQVKAEKTAREFIDFCTGRAWVFTDTGTQKDGEKLYQFTHTTFLEYFTASYLVRLNRTPDMLAKLLLPRIAKQEWDVMSLLTFQLQNKRIAGAGDELLNALIEYSVKTTDDNAWYLLSFAARCLEFIIPRPKVTREVVKICINRFLVDGIHWYNKNYSRKKNLPTSFNIGRSTTFSALSNATFENDQIINDYLIENIPKLIANNSNEIEIILIMEISCHRARSISDIIFAECNKQLLELYPKCFWLCYEAVRCQKMHIADLIKWHGVESVFSDQRGILNMRVSLAQLIARRVLDSPHEIEFSTWLIVNKTTLNEVGSILLSYPLPWIKIPHTPLKHPTLDTLDDWWFNTNHSPNRKLAKPLKLNYQGLFSTFVLIAVFLEVQEVAPSQVSRTNIIQTMNVIKMSQCLFFDQIRWIFCARFEQVTEAYVQEEIDRCGFTKQQQDFVWQWVLRKIDLVKVIDTKEESK